MPDTGITILPNRQGEARDDRIYREALMVRLEAGLLKLPPNGRRLLIACHATGDDKNMKLRRELAQREGISPNALRVRVHRLKTMLETYIKTDLDHGLLTEQVPAYDADTRRTVPRETLYARSRHYSRGLGGAT